MIDLERNPNGRINNCAIANHDHEDNCQVCPGVCPDRAWLVPPPLPENAFDAEPVIAAIVPYVEPALEGVVEDTPGLFSYIPVPAVEIVWTDEQEAALDEIDRWCEGSSAFYSLTGPAGTGKSTIVREIVSRYPDALLTAMTGKAALRLAECARRSATTLHKVLYYPPAPGADVRFTRLREPESMLVVTDEASMTSPAVFGDMKRWAEQGVRFLLVGDGYQLPPVIVGEEAKQYGEDFSVFSKVLGAALATVMRNAGGVLRAAERVRETGEICEESISLEESNYEFVRTHNPLEHAVNAYCEDRDGHLLITWKNSVRMQANRAIRTRFGHDGPLPDDGEPVLIKKNGQSFMNGEIVTSAGFEAGPNIGGLRTLWMKTKCGSKILVTVDGGDPERGGEFFDGSQPWVKDFRRYHIELKKNLWPEPIPITWGYALTCHAGQGSQSRRVTVFLNKEDLRNRNFRKPTTLPDGSQVSFSARWVYTATTRAVKRSTMIIG